MHNLLYPVIDLAGLQAIEAACAASRGAHRIDNEIDVKALMDVTDAG